MSREKLTRRNAIRSAGVLGALGVAGCSQLSGGGGGDSDQMQAAFVYQTSLGDVGWARAHENGRQALDDSFDWITTEYSDGVPGNEVRSVFEQYANTGYDIVYGCTTEYQDPMLQVAEEYPDVTFEHCNGFETAENMGRYMGKFYQGWYLCGVAAGHLTESNTLGMVVPIPIPQIIRQVNAFTLGARTVNEDATTKVRWLNGWADPSGARQAVNAIADEGADAIGSNMVTPAALQAATEREAYNFGVNTSMADQAGEYYATAQINNWAPFYKQSAKDVRNGEWSSDSLWGGLETDIVDIDDFGPKVPDDVVSDVETKRSEIENGERSVWTGTKFEGWSDAELFSDVGSYVEGVEGSVPSS
jgi:basic membrane protein A